MKEAAFFCIIILAGFIILIVRGRIEQKKLRKQIIKQFRDEYGAAPAKLRGREEAAVKGSYLHFMEKTDVFSLDDITWNDLDMDLIFQRINYTRSSAGTEELYRMLRCPVTEEEILRERDALADGMGEHETLREELSLELYAIGFTGKYALSDYLSYLDALKERSNWKHILLDLVYIPAAGLFFLEPAVGAVSLFLVLTVNIMSYFKEKGEVNPYLVSFAYILRMLRGAERIAGMIEKAERNGSLKAGRRPEGVREAGRQDTGACFRKYREILEKDIGDLKGFRRFSGVAMSMGNPTGSSGPLDLLFDYLKMAFHLDLMKFNQMLKVIRDRRDVIEEMVWAVGTLDACISVACYRASLGGWCRPRFDRSMGLRAEKLYHPLLERPVKNSITAGRGVLVTGSNASGKSTFLKTAALGAVFSQTICTVPAESYEAPFYRVMSSMALRDNLTGGESYFIVELRALKRILDACGEKKTAVPVLCFVDEVLRGTNTVERIAASSRILKSLTGEDVLCFAATHDIELTHLLENDYDNYHFEETIENGDISFNYLLKKGRAESRNAIRLLEVMGYDGKVIREAEQLAEHFVETGEWEECPAFGKETLDAVRE